MALTLVTKKERAMTMSIETARAWVPSYKVFERRLVQTSVIWDGEDRFFCFVHDKECGGIFLFRQTASMQRADEACAQRLGWSLEEYYTAIRADMAVSFGYQ